MLQGAAQKKKGLRAAAPKSFLSQWNSPNLLCPRDRTSFLRDLFAVVPSAFIYLQRFQRICFFRLRLSVPDRLSFLVALPNKEPILFYRFTSRVSHPSDDTNCLGCSPLLISDTSLENSLTIFSFVAKTALVL